MTESPNLSTAVFDEPADRLVSGTVLGKKYELLEQIGRGGMGGDGWTPLHRAAIRNRNVEVLRYLVSVPNVDVNAQDKAGKTPLDVANTEEKRAILRAAGGKSGN